MAKRGFFMYWFTPLGRMRDAAGSLGQAINESKERIKSIGPQKDRGDLDEGDVRRIADAGERFESMYKLHKWTPREIVQQKKALRAGKVTALAMAAFVFILSLGIIAMSSPMVQLFAMPLGIFITILALAQGFRYALFEAQLEMRALIDARTFLSLPDFWRRMLG